MKREEKQQYIEEKIILAILKGLESQDLVDISSSEIANNAEVSKRTLYKYFNSKTEMYLGLVKYCFNKITSIIEQQLSNIDNEEPLEVLSCIGNSYLNFYLDYPVMSKIITSYNEKSYLSRYPKYVQEISAVANMFEPSNIINQIYNKYNIKSSYKKESIALFVWSNIIGLTTLIQSKEDWITQYYEMQTSEIISENMRIVKSMILGEVINERN